MKLKLAWKGIYLVGALVLMLSVAGCGGGGGATATIAPPAQVTGVSATPGDTQATVSWTAVTGATAYNVYYSTGTVTTSSSHVNVASGTVTDASLTSLQNGTSYNIAVAAVNGGGEGAMSAPITILLAPAAPTGVNVTAGNTQATVSWTAATGATSYNVYYGTASGVTTSATTKVTGVTGTQTVVPGLTNNTTYYFVVTAVNAEGESAVSNEQSVVLAPDAPKGNTPSAGDGKVTITWTAPAGATSYNVYYDTTSAVTTSSTKVAGATSGQVVSPLTNGTTYYFGITAVGPGGESVLSSIKPATPAATPQPPATPTGVVVTSPSSGQVHVTWNLVSGATSYKVYYLATSTATNQQVFDNNTFATSSTTSLDLSLTGGTKYFLCVTAVNAAGESAPQNPTNIAKAITVTP